MSEKLAGKYSRRLAIARDKITKFQEELELDPAHALSWGTSAFAAAAEIKILRQLVMEFETGATAADVRAYLLGKVLNAAKRPPSSSSATSNLMEQYEMAAVAEIVSELEYS
jgi:hypothetical protein